MSDTATQPEVHLAPGIWRLAPSWSSVTFSVAHFPGVLPVRGTFSQVQGILGVGEDRSAEAEATIQVASVRTKGFPPGAPIRDWHLRSSQFFNAKRHPEILFKSTAIEQLGDELRVHGRLTIKGITRNADLVGRLGQVDKDADAIRVQLSGEIRRSEWRVGVAFLKLMVAERVKIALDVVGRRD